ncbi:MAG: hypothetical protein IJJ23_10590, partial [Clostridia bacterium]|nr:hypothetical protein [Clostridia bacterium]
MRRRVASTAAIVSLVCCLIFTLIYHQAVHDSLRADQVSDLLRLCRVSAEYVDAAALYASGDIDFREIIKVNSDFNIGAAVYDSEQNELVITPRYSLVGALSDQEDYVQALTEGYGTAITGPAGAKMIHVSVLTESGLLVRMNERVNEGAIITGSRARFMFLVALCTLLLCYVSVYLLSRKNDRFTDSTKYLLDAFAEGRFDARLKGVHGHHAHVAEVINSYADRIQKQVGRQSARNQAVSALMNQMQNGVLAVNASLEVMLMTPVARQLFGVHEPPEGKPVADICPEANLDHIFRESIGQPGVYTQELAVREGRTGRSVTPVKLYISPILQDGRSIGSVALVEDETEIRRLEQARNNFTANVSHELKTPLTSIRGFVETLLDGAIDQPEMARKVLTIIMMEANRLTRLVNDILSI